MSRLLSLFKGPKRNSHLCFIWPSSSSRAGFDEKEQFLLRNGCIYGSVKCWINMPVKGQCILCFPFFPEIHTFVIICIVRKDTFFFEIFLFQTWTFKSYIIKCTKERKWKLLQGLVAIIWIYSLDNLCDECLSVPYAVLGVGNWGLNTR